MLGYLADKARICGIKGSVSGCSSLCRGSMTTGPCSQHISYVFVISMRGNVV